MARDRVPDWARLVERYWEQTAPEKRQGIRFSLDYPLFSDARLKLLQNMRMTLYHLDMPECAFTWLLLLMGVKPNLDSIVLAQHKLVLFLRSLLRREGGDDGSTDSADDAAGDRPVSPLRKRGLCRPAQAARSGGPAGRHQPSDAPGDPLPDLRSAL